MNSLPTQNKVESDLYDIINGFSVLEDSQGREFFFKHISTKESLASDREYQTALSTAIRRGIQTEAQLLADAINYGKWTKEDDEFLKATEWEVKSLDKVRKKTTDPIQKAQILARAQEKEKSIQDRKKIKDDLCALSAEQLAERRRLEYLISCNCFEDKGFAEKHNLKDGDVAVLRECIARLNDRNHTIKIAYSHSFFDLYMIYKDQPHLIFGKNLPAMDMTIHQKNLIVFAGILLSKLENCSDKLTDEIKNNPIALYEFDPSDKKGESTDGIQDLKDKQKLQGEIKPEDWIS